jgi:hypothetical protein
MNTAFSSRKLLVTLSFIVSIALALAGCGGGSSSTTDTSKSFSNCYSDTNPGNSTNLFGNFIVSTDIWNPTAATSYSECINATVDLNLGVQSAQFDWTIVSSSNQVITYPNLQFGQQPGLPKHSTSRLPVLVSSMPNLNVTGTINTTCTTGVPCSFDSGFDIFFSATNPPSYPPKSELMILTSYDLGGYQPPSTLTATINGTTFIIRLATITNPNYSWPLVQYFATTPITQLNLNIKDFVADALNRGYVAPTDYLDVVEIGTEVGYGQGTTVITDYNIQ